MKHYKLNSNNIFIPNIEDCCFWETKNKKVMRIFGHYSLIQKDGFLIKKLDKLMIN